MTQKTDIGVVRDAAADILSQPTVADVGVEFGQSWVTPDNMPQGVSHKRVGVHPASRLAAARGIGVPLNPNDGIVTD